MPLQPRTRQGGWLNPPSCRSTDVRRHRGESTMAGRRLTPLGPRKGCGAFPQPCEEDIMPKEVLSILDQRSHATYEIPIQNGTIRAMDLRQIRSGSGDFGL